MGRIVKFYKLPATERRLLIRSWVIVGSIRLGLWTLPFKKLQSLLESFEQRKVKADPDQLRPNLERLVWAVKVASRLVPSTTCLTQALALKVLLIQNGYAAELRLGVVKKEQREIIAHAWVESDGRIIIGEIKDLVRYAPLPPLPSQDR